MKLRSWLCAAALAGSLGSMVSSASANDWYRWRGPEQNGISRETNLPEDWSPPAPSEPNGKNVAWTAPVGGMSCPIVMKGKYYALTRVGEVVAQGGIAVIAGPKTQEAVICLDAKTGKQLWQHAANMYMTDDPFHRIGWSSVTGDPATGRVYALGAQNEFVCLDGETGKVIWEHQMTEEYGLISTFGGRTPSPAIDEDQVFIAGVAFGWADNAGGAYRVFSFNKETGEPIWTTSTGGIPTDAPYQTPVITNINGEHVLVTGAGDGGVHCFQARTGKKLWTFKHSKRGFNAAVVVDRNRVYANWDLDNFDSTKLGRIVCIDPAQVKDGEPKEVWRLDGIEAGFPSATITPDGKTLFVPDDKGIIYSINTETGKINYKKGFGTIGKASLVWADGKLYFPEANGRMWILKPGEKKFEVLSHVDLDEKKGREYVIFGSVAIADGHVYLSAANTTYCIGPKEFKEQTVAIPEGPKEEPKPDGAKTALVQVVPCDVLLHPGQKVQLKARGFDEKGRLIGDVTPKWAIDKLTLPAPRKRPKALARPNAAAAAGGAEKKPEVEAKPIQPPPTTQPTQVGNLEGEVTADGSYAAAGSQFQYGAVAASDGANHGFARIRVLPPIPWKFDFDKGIVGKPPLTWIGAGMKFAIHEHDENGKPNKVLTKLTDIPLYARARTYFGTPDMSNYTIESDVQVVETVFQQGGESVHQIPDVGVINQRYVLELKGANQWLSLHAWPGALPAVELKPGWAIHNCIEYKWQAGKWYHLKLTVEQQSGKAIARGKVWLKGETEPKDWMIELTDGTPNTHGSPGLWGFSNDHEIYYDNVLVTPLNGAQALANPNVPALFAK